MGVGALGKLGNTGSTPRIPRQRGHGEAAPKGGASNRDTKQECRARNGQNTGEKKLTREENLTRWGGVLVKSICK